MKTHKKTKTKTQRTRAFYSVTIVGPDHTVTQINMIFRHLRGKPEHWIVTGTENGAHTWKSEFVSPKTAGCLFTDKIDDFLRKHVHR